MSSALCTTKPDLFFSTVPGEVMDAIDLCHQCPLLKVCDAGASEEFGVWAGVPRGEQAHAVRRYRVAVPRQRKEPIPGKPGRPVSPDTIARRRVVGALTREGYTAAEIALRLKINVRSVERDRSALLVTAD